MRVLADIPQPLREDFSQRLYTLLFSKRIVEWPHGFDVPEPAIAVANCRIALGHAHEGVVSTRREDALLKPSPQLGAGLDGVLEEAALFQTEDEGQKLPTSASSSATAESSSMHTPSPAAFAYGSLMEPGGYFRAFDNQETMDYFSNGMHSRNDIKTPAAAAAGVGEDGDGADDEYDFSRQHPTTLLLSPQQRGIGPEAVQVSHGWACRWMAVPIGGLGQGGRP